jgi:hypothetical protein
VKKFHVVASTVNPSATGGLAQTAEKSGCRDPENC